VLPSAPAELHCGQPSDGGQETTVTDPTPVRTWSTLATRRPEQFGHWRELICAAFLALTPESDLRDGFVGTVTQWSLGPLSLARIDSQRQRVRRTEQDIIRAPRDGYYANLQLAGTSEMRQAGRATVLRPGDLAVVDTGQPFAFDFTTDFRQVSFFVPGSLLTAQLPGPVPTATRIGTTGGIGAAIRHSLSALPSLPPRSAARLAVHACGLLALALDSPADVIPIRSRRTHALAVADIEEHLADDDLSPAATAGRIGISVRALHGLFAGQERSYTATVRRLRLDQTFRDLLDPARRHLRVIDVAADAGFADVASFHRAFRREFGRTPAQVRATGAADAGK
jgi:AraC family transcriptional activator of tynA and feaB